MGTLDNQLPTISELDQLIAIGSRVEVVDDYGAVKITLSHQAVSIRAKVRYAMTNESEQEKQEKFTQEIKIWIRYNTGYTSENYVYWNATYWQIISLETTPRNRFLVFKCRSIAQ